MPVKTLIIDPKTGKQAALQDDGESNALIVATRSLKEFNNRPFYFITSEGSKDMNIAVTFGGTPAKVHDGIDSVLWTGSSIQGSSVTFNSALQNHTAAGATSVQIDNAAVDDILQFAKGSNLDCTGYSAITMWVYVDKDWISGDSISLYGWDTDTGLQVGDAINLEEYFDFSTVDTWQKIAIALTDMGDVAISTVLDALRMRIVTQAGIKGPKVYFDDIQFEETGAPVDFTVEPRPGTWLYIETFDITVVDAYDTTLASNSMPKIPYSGFLGVSSLTIGLQAKRVQGNIVMFSATFKDFIDFLGLPKTQLVGCGSDGTDTWIKTSQEMAQPLILKSENADKFVYTVRDDLSGLKRFWISVACYEETRA